ncbi:MAG: DUF4912 domain-containing protein [Spirochaetota bacterium]
MENKSPKEKKRIYEDKSLQKLPDVYDRDVAKIMVKNPLESYAFWSISSTSKTKIKETLGSTIEVSYELLVKYDEKETKTKIEEKIALPPKTDNWTLSFKRPPENLHIELLVKTDKGRSMSLFHSATVQMPDVQRSKKVQQGWIGNDWQIKQTEQGQTQKSDFNTDTMGVDESSSNTETKTSYEPPNHPGSSGNFIGSSDNSPGSSYSPYKR